MPKWEYFGVILPTVPHEAEGVTVMCNGYGQRGWELVGFASADFGRLLFLFKRPCGGPAGKGGLEEMA